jgi:gluconolactonase
MPEQPFPAVLVTDGLNFPEGPVALAGGDILVCEIATGDLVRVAPDGAKSVAASVGGGPNGLAMGPDGRVYVANNGGSIFTWDTGLPFPTGRALPEYESGSLQAVDLETGEFETLITEVDGRPLAGPNDLAFDRAGGLYFTDLGKGLGDNRRLGGLYYLPSGAREARTLAYPLDGQNGVALSADGNRLYASETPTGRVFEWEIEAPGVLRPGRSPHHPGHGTLLCTLPGFCNLDSIAVDGEGHICVATLFTGAVTVVSPEGRIVETVRLPDHDPYVTNLCFGGPDHRTAYVTCSSLGRLYAVRWPWAGLPVNFSPIAA